MPHQLARGFQLRGAFGQAKAYGLVVDDGRAKTLALLGILNGHFQGTARHANALCGNANAATFERRQGNLVTFAFLPDQVLDRHFAVFKIDLRGVARVLTYLVFQSRHHIAWCARRHDECTHAFFAGTFVGHSQHNGHIAIFATGNKLLHAIEHIRITFARGCGSDGRGI